jgi:hypothetical protein
MVKRGELRADADPKHLARVLVAAHQGGSQLSQTAQSIKPLRDALNAAVQYVQLYATESPNGEGWAWAKLGRGRSSRSKKST